MVKTNLPKQSVQWNLRETVKIYVVHNKKHTFRVNYMFLNFRYDILLKSAEIYNMIFHTIFYLHYYGKGRVRK